MITIPLFVHFFQQFHNLINFFLALSLLNGFAHATHHVGGQHLPVRLTDHRGGSHELVGDVHTVAVFLHHFVDAVQLSPGPKGRRDIVNRPVLCVKTHVRALPSSPNRGAAAPIEGVRRAFVAWRRATSPVLGEFCAGLRKFPLRRAEKIPPRRGRLVRPLLATSRAEITAYLEAHGLSHVEDASNADPAFARNKLRHQVLPLLQALNPRLEEALGESIRRLRADNDYLNAQAAGMAREAAWADDDLVIRAQLVARAPDPIAVRIIRWMLLEMGEHQFSAAHLQAVVDLARSSAPSGRVDLAHGLTAYRVYGDLLLTVQGEDPLPPFTPVPLALEGETSLPEAGWALTCRRAVTPAEAPQGGNHFFLDPARLSGPLVLRPRQTGDRLALPGRGEKTVKKLLIDGKVPRRLRERVPVLADGAGVVWLGGFGPHRDRLAAPGVEALEVAAVRG